ncbi:ribosome-associated translation inhibitor RaiA [bacterium]|nr:ribosome-associated translation inhibitor RaiA [bacterium]
MRFKLEIKGTNIKISPSLRSAVKEKIGGLEKLIKDIGEDFKQSHKVKPAVEGWVELEKRLHHRKGDVFRVECQIKLPGKSVRAESVKNDIFLAITEVKDELQRILKQYKEKQISKVRRSSRKFKEIISSSSVSQERKKR